VAEDKSMKMRVRKAVFPAAGLGTRFLPATKAQPKEMLPLVDKPIIQYGVEEALASGCDQIIIITGRGKTAIEDHFDVSYELEKMLEERGKTDLLAIVRQISDMIHVAYVRQKEAMGLGHAVLMARELVGNEPFAVLLADDVIDAPSPCLKQMMEVFDETQSSVIAAQEVSGAAISSYGVLDARRVEGNFQGRVHDIANLVEKPRLEEAPSNLAIIGRYILTPAIFNALERTSLGAGGELQLTDGLRTLLKAGEKIYGYTFEGKRHDAGDKLGFLKATVELALKRPDLGGPFAEYLRALAENHVLLSHYPSTKGAKSA
jgi:UTP--glucose-1-phosphate uridylyltransferase